jgi:hypothetical protein
MHHGGQGRVPVRAIKTTTISILAVGLLAGSAVGAAGQEATGPAHVTGTITVSGECTEAAFGAECPIVIEASDQRLSGEGFVRNGDVVFEGFDGGEGVMVIANTSLRVENADGAWSGGGPFYALPGNEEAFGTAQPTWVLTGEDGYDGLTAVLRANVGEVATFGGVVFEGDLPPAPPLE